LQGKKYLYRRKKEKTWKRRCTWPWRSLDGQDPLGLNPSMAEIRTDVWCRLKE